MEFRNDIQGLRALAVLLVFVFHLSSSWLPGGFIGVDIFFVISGYLVSSIILHKLDNNKFSLLQFYESRIKRIIPAYLFLLLIIALVVSFTFLTTDVYKFRQSLFWSILFCSNSHFATLDNYFGTASSANPLLHTWTLGVEMQFYLILPLILVVLRSKKLLISVLIVIMGLLLGYTTYNLHDGNTTLMYFSLLARMPEFLVGVLVAVLNLRDYKWVKVNSTIMSSIGLAILILCGFFFHEEMLFPGITALLPSLGTIFILVSSNNQVNSFLSNKYLVYLGEISYSIYLWHWPIMAFIRYKNDGYDLSAFEMVVATVLTVIGSVSSYYIVEKAMRKAKGAKFYLPFAIMGGATILMLFLVVKISKLRQQEFIGYLSPSFGLDSHGSTFKNIGILGDSTSTNKKILFIGDSHALSMKKYIDVLGRHRKFKVSTITNDKYPTIPGIEKNEFSEGRLYNRYMDLIKYVSIELPTSKLIVVQFANDGERWHNSIKDMINNLNPTQKVIFLVDFPVLDKNPVKINQGIVKNEKITQEYVVTRNRISKEILSLIDRDSRCKLLDFSNDSVFDDIPFYKDTLMYYDSGHLNIHGSKYYALETEEEFMEAIKWGLK